MAHPIIDVDLKDDTPNEILLEKHTQFLKHLEDTDDPRLDYMKLSAIYWTLTALDLMKKIDVIEKEKVLQLVMSCYHEECGGFGPAPKHDAHMLSTLSAIQILALYDALDKVDSQKVVGFIVNLQNPNGSFRGDQWTEVDSRFSFCAIATLTLLGVIKPSTRETLQPVEGVDIQMAVDYLVRCQNPDGGFATQPGSESHAGQAFCVVGALSLLGQLRRLDIEKASSWLAERQLPNGGLNGRPGKMPDVCYSWWVLSALSILGHLPWIDAPGLARFICACQDAESGGFSDRPGNQADPFHTLFGLAGLSLLAQLPASETESVEVLKAAKTQLRQINPVLCLPQHVVERLKLSVQIL